MGKISYSANDFTALKSELISMLKSSSAFKDYNFEGSNITTLIELVAAVGDLFNYYINATANEYFLDTGELYVNLNRIAKQLGYNPGGVKSSTVVVAVSTTFTLEPDQDDYYFEIPKYSPLSCRSQSPLGEDIKYLTVNKTTFIGVSGDNAYTASWNVVQGISNTLSANGVGTDFQVIEVTNDKAIEEYMEVWVNGELWNYVENLYHDDLIVIDGTSQIYTTRFNPNKRVEVQFGNGVFGARPTTGVNNVVIKYIESLGADGKVGELEITALDNPVYINNTQGIPTQQTVTFEITQVGGSEGGRDPLTETEISNLAPKFYRTQDRMVTLQDHEDKLLSGFNDYVAKVRTLNSDDYFALTGETTGTSGLMYNNLYLYVVPRYNTELSGPLQEAILEYIEKFKMTSMNYIFKPINYHDFYPFVDYKKIKNSTKLRSEIERDIESFLRTYFSRTSRDFADEIKYSEIVSGLNGLEGVSSLTLEISCMSGSALHENVQLTSIEFPRLAMTWLPTSGIHYSGEV